MGADGLRANLICNKKIVCSFIFKKHTNFLVSTIYLDSSKSASLEETIINFYIVFHSPNVIAVETFIAQIHLGKERCHQHRGCVSLSGAEEFARV